MADKYLISSVVDGVETFYTADPSGVISSIGTTLNWDYGFDSDVLSYIDNNTYSTLVDAKVWVNRTNLNSVVEDTTGDGIIKTTDSTAIDCSGYSGISSMVATGSDNTKCKIILSFDGKTYYTRGTGTIASSTAAIPVTDPDDETAIASRNTNTVAIADDFNTLFDGNVSSIYQYVYDTDDVYTPLQIDIAFVTAITARSYKINILDTCRLPAIISLQRGDYDADTNTTNWVEIDQTIVRTPKIITRYFTNDTASSNYRWVINADSTDLADDPSLAFEACELNIYGQTTGTTWLTCTENEVKDKGLTFSELNALTSDNFKEIFDQTQIDYAIYIPSGYNITSVVANFPANGSPVIDYFTVKNKIHSDDVTAYFQFTDPEGDICNYEIYVNGVKAAAGINAASGTRIGPITLKNSYFNKIDDHATRDVEATNDVELRVIDTYDAKGILKAIVTKIDYLPTYIGSLVDNVYTLSIDNEDKDKCKYTAYLNGKEIHHIDLTAVPINNSKFELDSDDILIDQQNELKIVIEDAVGGTVNVITKFIGEYHTLLYYNDENKILSSDKGTALRKLDFGTVLLGKTSENKLVYVVNKTSKALKNLVIKSPKDLDGVDTKNYDKNGIYINTTHTDGTIYVQLSLNDAFSDKDTYYAITISNLAVNQKEPFYVRVQTTNPGAVPDIYDFDVQGIADEA